MAEKQAMDAADRVLVTHAAPEAFAPTTREMLEKLGYRIVESEDYEKSREEGGKASALLRLVDERRLFHHRLRRHRENRGSPHVHGNDVEGFG